MQAQEFDWNAYYERMGRPAREAWNQGLLLYHVLLPLSQTVAYGPRQTWTEVQTPVGHVVQLIEGAGWRLDQMAIAFEPTGQLSRDRWVLTGQHSAVSGVLVGSYLFRRPVPPTPV